MTCMAQITCDLHHEQIGPDECVCKPDFDENCENCKEGFEYDSTSDSCLRTEYICEEEWTGDQCDICPVQFKITVDSSGRHCGLECADNRAPIAENPTCETCAPGYEFSSIDNTCITTECTTGQEGYIKDEETGACRCDTENGWRMSAAGVCEKMEGDLIGSSDSNINNAKITVANDGVLRDVLRDETGIERR